MVRDTSFTTFIKVVNRSLYYLPRSICHTLLKYNDIRRIGTGFIYVWLGLLILMEHSFWVGLLFLGIGIVWTIYGMWAGE